MDTTMPTSPASVSVAPSSEMMIHNSEPDRARLINATIPSRR